VNEEWDFALLNRYAEKPLSFCGEFLRYGARFPNRQPHAVRTVLLKDVHFLEEETQYHWEHVWLRLAYGETFSGLCVGDRVYFSAKLDLYQKLKKKALMSQREWMRYAAEKSKQPFQLGLCSAVFERAESLAHVLLHG
jgi:hypothetical protein